ncbi:MAG: transposase [Anaerolineae bacterium]|nr:transposase [Anaerolineae bacterium]
MPVLEVAKVTGRHRFTGFDLNWNDFFAIHLRNRQEKMTERGYKRQVQMIEKQLGQLIQRTFKGLGRNLFERYRKYRNSLFIFLDRLDVPAHNNACERALRPSVIRRKVLCSFRSDWGAQA